MRFYTKKIPALPCAFFLERRRRPWRPWPG